MNGDEMFGKDDPAKIKVANVDSDIQQNFDLLAKATGGRPCYNRTDLDNCIKEAVNDNDGSYLLGYYLDRKNTAPGWHKLAVQVARKDVRIQARNGFFRTALDPEASRNLDLRLALNSPLDYSTLKISGKWLETVSAGDKRRAQFELRVPGAELLPEVLASDALDLDIVAMARTLKGTSAGEASKRVRMALTAEQATKLKTEGLAYTGRLDLVAGL